MFVSRDFRVSGWVPQRSCTNRFRYVEKTFLCLKELLTIILLGYDVVLQNPTQDMYQIFRGHLNHASNLTYVLPNNLGTLARWWRLLDHGELVQRYCDHFFDSDQSGVVIYDIIYVALLLS